MLHHFAITVSDLPTSMAFYRLVLEGVGYALSHYDEKRIAVWLGPNPEILIYQARTDQLDRKHVTYDPGIHHIAFQVDEREVIDKLWKDLKLNGYHILDDPREYPEYAENYYAVFFEDPDGIKLELMCLSS
ncbi:VOC family protein [Methylomicrobium lacus]|uniref:VOC family protein n=1 Tax=Methylomicrobium lacus TaxID=136992 RepID=UPI0035A91130